ncbi:hypothetical protein GQ457_13G022700 [Hibiscus cannabinus]
MAMHRHCLHRHANQIQMQGGSLHPSFSTSPRIFFHLLTSSLPRRAVIDTLLPNRRLLVERTMFTRNGAILETVTVDGVVVSVPDLFIGSHIIVHGLDGILAYRSLVSDTDNNITIAAPQNAPANSPGNFPRSLHRAGYDKDLLISAMVGSVFAGFLNWFAPMLGQSLGFLYYC